MSETNVAYTERNMLVALLARMYPSGTAKTAIDGWDAAWHGCVYIDLPTGQASWHYHDSDAYLFAALPAYAGRWDGHDTPEKYRRVMFLRNQFQWGQMACVPLVDGELVSPKQIEFGWCRYDDDPSASDADPEPEPHT